jgi:FtsP/CotA-like multicopper oxidase with cupredoxin domain
LHTHGLRIGPDVDDVFITVNGGESHTYVYNIPSDHHAGNHWYHAHLHGASAFHVMGGQVGALIVEPKLTTHIPAAWRSVTRKVLTFTHVFLEMADGSTEATDPFSIWSFNTLSDEIDNKLDINPEYYIEETNGLYITDAWFVNGQFQPYLRLHKNEWIIFDLICASGDRLLELEVRTAVGSYLGAEVNTMGYCETHLLAVDGVYLTNSRSGTFYKSTRHLVLVQAQRATIAFKCARAGTYYFQTVGNNTSGDSKDIGDVEVKSSQNLMTIIVENIAAKSPVTISDFSLSTIPRPSYISNLLSRT